MSDIFISYKREDITLVRALAEELSELGWSIWWDQDIPAGRAYDTVIEEELESCKCVVVLWSKHSVVSPNVKAEANEALNSNKYIPVIIGDTRPPLLFRYIQAVAWNETSKIEVPKFNELVKHIKRLLGEPPKTNSTNPEVKTSKAKKDKSKTTVSKSQPQKKAEPTESLKDSNFLKTSDSEKKPDVRKTSDTQKKPDKKEEVYKLDSVKIGNQIWMKENLDVERFRNGDSIPEVKSGGEWTKAGENKQPAWCYFENDPANGKIYGKLYNWYAVNDPRGLAPEGWHVPSDMEWGMLVEHLGGDSIAGGKMKSTGTQYWESPNEGATNESGFSGLPGGYYTLGVFINIRLIGYWWSSSRRLANNAWYCTLRYTDSNLNRNNTNKVDGFSVRCLRD